MIESRFAHTATLLANGKVLVAGGQGGDVVGNDALASAELYDPSVESWTATLGMKWSRSSHTATALADDRVLVAGGFVSDIVASAELYEPGSGS
jgi:hypothetical protein